MAETLANNLFAERWLARIRATRANIPVTVITARLTGPMRTSQGGRKSKGPRELLGARPPAPLAEAVRNQADQLGMTVNDYLVMLMAQAQNMPEFAPKPADTSRLELPIPAA